jgi:serine/threonine protein phosphatase PrpC
MRAKAWLYWNVIIFRTRHSAELRLELRNMILALGIEVAARTDIGLARRSNQDCFGCDDELGLYVVCDGMGGAAGGEIASSIAVETFLAIARQELQSLEANTDCDAVALKRATAAANRAVVVRAGWDIGYRGMGTTLVAGRLKGDRLTVINVGDSRAYLVREDRAIRLTEDHSHVAEQIRLGLMTAEEAEISSLRSVITRAIGAEADVMSDLIEVQIMDGDKLLLTSDGLIRHVSDDETAETIRSATTADEACERLISLARQRGGSDNITCIVVCVVDTNDAKQGD